MSSTSLNLLPQEPQLIEMPTDRTTGPLLPDPSAAVELPINMLDFPEIPDEPDADGRAAREWSAGESGETRCSAESPTAWVVAWQPYPQQPPSLPYALYQGFFRNAVPEKTWHLTQAALFLNEETAQRISKHLPTFGQGLWIVIPLRDTKGQLS